MEENVITKLKANGYDDEKEGGNGDIMTQDTDQTHQEKEEEEIEVITPAVAEAKIQESLAHKARGNALFAESKYVDAINAYTSAIETCPAAGDGTREHLSTFYGNRAACHFRLYEAVREKNQNLDDVKTLDRGKLCISDCTKSLEFRPAYLKVLLRRASCHEIYPVDNPGLQAALDDYNAILKIDPQNKVAYMACKRLPKQIKEQTERLKEEMWGKLKDLGNMCLNPFGLSTDNFKMTPDGKGGYSVNFSQ